MDPAFASYVAAHRAELERERESLPALAAQALAAAKAAAARIAERLDVTRIYLFGSLARGGFRPDSDIDLAVEGLAPSFKAS
jgi:predicted nucleotidyltransferase